MTNPEKAEMHALAPEVRLLLAASRVRLGASDEAALGEAAATVNDWERVLATADHHGCTPLLALHLLERDWRGVPAGVRQAIDQRYKANARQSLVLTADLFRCLDLLESHGITAVPYKGAALASSLYGELGLREFSDTDLLVKSADAERAYEALLSAGFRTESVFSAAQLRHHLRTGCEVNFRVPWGDTRVELHWQIVPCHLGVRLDVPAMFGRLEQVRIGERAVKALAPEDLLLVLSVHGGKHGWERLAWVTDIHELLLRASGLDCKEALARAEAAGAERYLLLGCRLAQRMLGARLPGEIDERVRADAVIDRLAGGVISAFAAPATLDTNWARWTFLLQMKRRWRERAGCVWRYAMVPDAMDWEWVPLPEALGGMYPALRVARLALTLGRAQTPRMFRERGRAPAAHTADPSPRPGTIQKQAAPAARQ